MTNPMIIVDYNPNWKVMFEEEKSLIMTVMEDLSIEIEHIGSTSVPGLGAKPVIDIMAGVEDLVIVDKFIESLAKIGYEYVPEYERDIPERRFFNKGSLDDHKHLHIVELESDFWTEHILFRDYIRSHPDVANRYYELKLFLVKKFKDDIESYTSGKTGFIKSVVRTAREEKIRREK